MPEIVVFLGPSLARAKAEKILGGRLPASSQARRTFIRCPGGRQDSFCS